MVFLSIILFIGLLTTFTDIKKRKIYNQHLIIGAILGLGATIWAALFNHEKILFHLTDGLAASFIGFLMHRSNLWKGGDAKLFALYAYLMPAPAYQFLYFPGTFSLFTCSFILGMAILSPILIKDIFTHRREIINDLWTPAKRDTLFHAISRIVFSSWILFPLYHFLKIKNPLIILVVSYLFFSWRYNRASTYSFLEVLKNYYPIISVNLILGLLLNIWLCPNAFSLPAFLHYLMMIVLTTIASTCIHTAFDHFKNYDERVPFAPLLFLGCLLSYSPFLIKLMNLVNFWNNLLYS